jgi:hypothetical protein
MKKLRFLLLDANVIIKLHELKLWDPIVERCDVFVAETVVREAQYFEGDAGHEAIDLTSYIESKRITSVGMTGSDVAKFRDGFSSDYLERIDPGEAESLAFLLSSNDPCQICSADAIVYRILGRLNRGEQGISLEEILHRTGLSTAVPHQYRRAFREHWTQEGQQDMIRSRGLR